MKSNFSYFRGSFIFTFFGLVVSSFIGYYYTPTTASMLFLLESPFAFLFGYLLLKETLNLLQIFGALIILLSSYLTVLWEEPTSHSTTPLAQ